MILKKRFKPLTLRALIALQSRLPTNHPQLSAIQRDIAKRRKGFIGEQKVDYHLQQQIPNSYTQLQDVCLLLNGRQFNIDTLILSNHAIYIIETKHFNGKLIFNTILDQFTRIDPHGERGYGSPITQAETQQLKLDQWLSDQNIHDIPIHYFIAISDPSTIIEVIGDAEMIASVVSHAAQLPKKIMQLDDHIKNKSKHNFNGRLLGQRIVKKCTEFSFDILKEYQISKADISPGIHCSKCNHLGMKRKYGSWQCEKCGNNSKSAHLKALSDYFLLINHSISNKECRYFLRISSRRTTTYILKISKLIFSKKDRRWFPNEKFSIK